MFLVTASFGFIQPFVPLYMESSGLTRSDIGIVMGVGTGLAMLIQPLLGRLSDRIDARRPLLFGAALAAGAAYLAYRSAHGVIAFTLLTAVGTNGTMYLNAAGGVLVGRMVTNTAKGGAAYAGYRVWGSVGYIIVTLLTGWLLSRGAHVNLNREALNSVFTYGPLLFIVIAIAALGVPDRKTLPPPSGLPSNMPEVRPPLSLNLRIFLVAYFFYQFGLYGASGFLSLYLKHLHAAPIWITSTFAVGVICEVTIMTRIGRLTDRFGRRPALAVAYLIMPLRMLLYIPATGPLWVMAVQSLHGFNFGIMGAIAVVFVNDLATDRDRGAAQARLMAVQGLATAIGPVLCGRLVQAYGFGSMFSAMSAAGAIGAAVFLLWVKESHTNSLSVSERGPAVLRPVLRLLEKPLLSTRV